MLPSPSRTNDFSTNELGTHVDISRNECGRTIVKCGSIHAGDADNIIPDYLDLKLTVRIYVPEVRKKAMTSVKRVIETEKEASGATQKLEIKQVVSCPSTANDEAVVREIKPRFKDHFGENPIEMAPDPESDDFAQLAGPHKIPYAYWTFGSTNAEQWNDAKEKGRLDDLPSNYSALFAPAVELTLSTSVEAMA